MHPPAPPADTRLFYAVKIMLSIVLHSLLLSFWAAVVGIVRLFFGIEGVNRLLLVVSPLDCALILRLCGAKVGNHPSLSSPLIITNATNNYSNLTVGDAVHIGKGTLLDLH